MSKKLSPHSAHRTRSEPPYRKRTVVTTRYGRWIIARRKLVNHLASGKAKYNLE